MSPGRRDLPLRRRFPVRRRSDAVILAVLGILLAVVLWQYYQTPPPLPDALAEGEYEVERVVDGDTLRLTNGAPVRLIGVNAPEAMRNECAEPWGPEATQFTAQFVADHPVRLEFDAERKDRYGRHLAYVWVGDRMLNEELVRAGLAHVETGFRYADEVKRRFLQAEAEAKSARRGIWSGRVTPAQTP